NAAYASTALPRTTGKANGLKYDGTDETATVNSILTAMSNFGGGELALEGPVRCDSQIIVPTTTSGAQVRQAPIRITGTPQNAPGSTFTGSQPYGKMAGLDLRYAGRTDASCGTTKGSTYITNAAAVAADRGNIVTGPGIPDQCWILAVDAGNGWVVSKAARATGTVSLTNFGGRFQGLGYGTLEIDHLTFQNNGNASSAPFGLTTGPRVNLHDNVFVGHSTKTDNTCDEDIWIFGGPGQGTYLATALSSGQTYTSLAVQALPVDITGGRTVTLGFGTGQTQDVTIASNTSAGATSIPVTSFTANANYGVHAGVYIGSSEVQQTLNSWSVAAAPFQGYPSRVWGNSFYRVRRILAGLFTTDLYIDHNAWMHNCGTNLAQKPSTLTTALTQGSAYTSLAVTALDKPVLAGDTIQIAVATSSTVSQTVTASADAAAGATSIAVNSFTAAAAFGTGTVVFNPNAGLGAMVESYVYGPDVNTIHVHHNRMGFSGGYNYATRFAGNTVQSVIEANNFQDVQADANFIAGHRFDYNARFNVVIPGLLGAGVTVADDWSYDGTMQQTILNHDQSKPTRLPQGLVLGNSLVVGDPVASSFLLTDTVGRTLATIGGAGRQWDFKGQLFIDGNEIGGSTALTVGNNSTAGDAQINLNPTSAAQATLRFSSGGASKWQFYTGAVGASMYLRDLVNGVMTMEVVPAAGVGAKARFSGVVRTGSAATAGRPTGLNGSTDVGSQFFDTTLGKPIWWNGTGWVDATG
ncbi:MAG TPA: hypothetical protein VFH56_01820, partial [Acidimicrobiales bacterium]|nr:hypothetical protein [Acidimicrobiales bacterium]